MYRHEYDRLSTNHDQELGGGDSFSELGSGELGGVSEARYWNTKSFFILDIRFIPYWA